MATVIEVRDLHRHYRVRQGLFSRKATTVHAVRGISFSVGRGEVFGLLGQNGAGKTTTIKILTTMLVPTSGTARVLGLDTVTQAVAIRHRINFIFGGENGLYGRLSGYENLRYFADLYKLPRARQKSLLPQLIELVGLTDHIHNRVETYSKGMKQRLHIARGLLNDPEVLFLDEPTLGLDPYGATELRRLIRELSARGKAILLTTHYMHEADELCNRIAILKAGQVVALDSPQNLKRLAHGISVLEFQAYDLQSHHLEAIRALPGASSVTTTDLDGRHLVSVQTEQPDELMPAVIRLLDGCRLHSANIRQATLEDAYMRLTGE